MVSCMVWLFMGEKKEYLGCLEYPESVRTLPQTVDVTVGTCGDCPTGTGELCFWFTSWREFFDEVIVSSMDLNPLDVVFLFHGMGNITTGNENPGRGLFDDRNMFLLPLVCGLFSLQDHISSTAYEITGSGMEHNDHIPACITFVNLILRCHNLPRWQSGFISS